MQGDDATVAIATDDERRWDRLEAFLRQELDVDGAFGTRQFSNGAANLTFLVRFGDRELVVRRPPFGVIAPGAHDMGREHRVLSRLWREFDRAPRALVFCDDHEVFGADFFVMERRPGVVIQGDLPADMVGLPDVGRRVGLAVVDAMADLHLVDPAACDLDSLGRPDGFVDRQVSGWHHRWSLSKSDASPSLMDEVGERLAETLPPAGEVSLVHNDLKLDNCAFLPDQPDRAVAVFDWDMTTRGNPLVDLGTLLNYWPDPGDGEDVKRGSHDGMSEMGLPTRAEVVERYAERTGFDVSTAPWFEAFAQWKTAVVFQQLHRRWLDGDSADDRHAEMGDTVDLLAASASELLDSLS
ncbi:MAG: phosphotransferase family protein [Actinomycetota bacterium]